MNWLTELVSIANKPSRIVAGAISGTSVDAIKVSLCKISGAGPLGSKNPGKVELLHFSSHPYPSDLRQRLYKSLTLSTQDISELNVLVAKAFGEAITAAAGEAKISLKEIDLVGSHGQTLYHHSNRQGVLPSTLQVGDGDTIAEITGCTVISDFRTRDIAAGGEDAPLTPYSDLVLFSPDSEKTKIVLNLGGVANITVLSLDVSSVIGFDTGPANGPLDRLARIITDGREVCDKDGAIGRAGKINEKLLREIIDADRYLVKPPPKSTGFEMYGDDFVADLIERHGAPDSDLMATIAEFVAYAIGSALKRFVQGTVAEVIVAGGGQRNPFLINRIKAHVAPAIVTDSDVYGVPSQARESMGVAVLANDAFMGLPTSLPSVTGSRRPVPLGKVSYPVLR